MNEGDFTIRLGTGSFFLATVSCWRVFFFGVKFVDAAPEENYQQKMTEPKIFVFVFG